MNAIVEQHVNPFSNAPVVARPTAGIVSVEQQRAVAEVQAAMIVARANPRDAIKSLDMILQDCMRPTLAEGALYTYSRGGADVSGPSIRLAESIARRWGNMECGVKELSRHNGYSECIAYAWDLETNFRDAKTFQVKHWRDTKKGGYAITDERDIYELVANMGARRKRACVLAIIPGDVTEAAVTQCEATLKAKADTSPDAMQKMVTAFEQFGVTREQVERRIQRRLDAIQPAQVVSLKKIYTSLRDGMSNAGDWFESLSDVDAPPATTQTDAVKQKLRAKVKTQQPGQTSDAPVATYAQIAERLQTASDLDALDTAADLIAELPDPQQREELVGIYKQRSAALNK